MQNPKTIAVIPARYASSRLPGKLMLDLGGKTIIQRVYERVKEAKLVDEVYIATDDQRIFDHAKSFGANVEMTSVDHKSGTDRIAELANKHLDWSIIVNVQGDEPFINPDDIDKAIEPFKYDPQIQMTSLYHPICDQDEINNPNNVKVVTDINDNALYFSRTPIPYCKDANIYSCSTSLTQDSKSLQNTTEFKKHIGLYAYKRETLLTLSNLKQTPLEQAERLEQLRALENQISIKMIEVDSAPLGIDTEDDLAKAHKILLKISEKV